MTNPEAPIQTRTALYLDFDNLYSGLDNDRELHKAFCQDPRTWLSHVETGWGAPAGGRRILVARAYLNPAAHSSHRRHLTSAGFEVVDTPSLTSQGKSAADIRIAIDMLDALADPVHYDEFIVLSGDADFTPVLYRLRANDRRTMIVSSKPVAAAYRHVADLVVDRDSLRDFVGLTAPDGPDAPVAPTLALALAADPAPVQVAADPVLLVLGAAARVIESRRATESGLPAAVVAEAAAEGHVLELQVVRDVLAVFDRAGLPVLLAAEPTPSALLRTYRAICEPGGLAA